MALSIPEGVSAIRFGTLPSRGRSVVPLVTMAPKAVRSTCGASKPKPNVHDATSTGLRRCRPRPRSTLRSSRSAMEMILHAIPIDAVGAHAGPVLTGEQVAARPPRRRAAKARSYAAPHGCFEGDLYRRRRNLLPACRVDQRLEHRGRAARENVPTVTLSRN